MQEITKISAKFAELKSRYAERDIRMAQVAHIRANNPEMVADGLFSPDWPKPMVANFIAVAAHDLAEVTAPLPSVQCHAPNSSDDTARRRAEKKTRICSYYTEASRLQAQMYPASDWYYTYGFIPFRVEPNFEEQRPHLQLDDPTGAYPDFDRWGNVVAYAKSWRMPTQALIAMFPDYANEIAATKNLLSGQQGQLELVRWDDAEGTTLFLSERAGLRLGFVRNPIGKCPVSVAKLPSFDGQFRGQFDDVIWPQLAKAKMAMLKLEAAEEAVQAPLIVPDDMDEFPLGRGSIMRTRDPAGVRRVELNVPAAAFAEEQVLEKELRVGTRYPETRGGNPNANVITGRGIQELEGGFDTQVKTAQQIIAQAMQDAYGMMLAMDQALWPDVRKEISGTENGTAFSLSYTPSKDIRGDYTVSVDYGLMTGLDPNRMLVWGLQARSDKLISRNFLRSNLPIALNSSAEEEMIDIEDARDALKQAMAGYVQALPVIAQQGQDPRVPIAAVAAYTQARKSGKSIEDAAALAFTPPEAEEPPPVEPGQEAPPGEGGPGGPAGPGEVPLGMDAATGSMRGVPLGQQGSNPGGRPDMRSMLAGLTSSGQANLTASVSRRRTI